MEAVATDLGKKGVEKLIDKIIAELRHICCYTCIVENFEKEKKWLEAEWKTVGQRNQEAKRKGKDIAANVSHWEEEAEVLLNEDTKTNPTCFPGCISRYRRGRELANKTEDIKTLVREGKTLENGSLAPRLPGVERYSSQYYISFKSRESKYKELLDALKDDNNYMIGLQGMGGTGKTTLVKQVGKQLVESKQFDHVIDTTVSSSPNMKKIQDDIAASLGLQWEDCTGSERLTKLWSRLTNGEKILLILDDVWDWQHVKFEEIGIPSIDNHKCCRVLVTTRNLHVCNSMRCERIVQLGVLSDDDAWIMFKTHAGIDHKSSKSLLDKGEKIAKECRGLPVAIEVIARSLRGQQRQDEWDVALKSLQMPHFSMLGVDETSVEIYKCLKISYDNMKDKKDKELFLLFSVFPEDMKVPNGLLTRFGIGAGIVGEVDDKYDDARMKVVLAINRLIDSCILLKDDRGFLTMHDLVRDAALWIANEEIQEVNLSNKNKKSPVERVNNIKYLSCKGKGQNLFSRRIDGSKLEILNIFMDNECDDASVEIPNLFFENMKRLQLLYICRNSRRRQALSLPQSIQLLMNIRSLLFYHLELGDISILGNLQSLETLEFFQCRFIELPLQVSKLEKLRLLGLDGCKCKNPYKVIERCSSLEELYIAYEGKYDRTDIVAVHQLRTPLQRYVIFDENKNEDYMEGSPSPSKQLSLLRHGPPFFSVATMKYFVQTAEDLRLNGNKFEWGNLIPEIAPIDEGMNDLVKLHLESFPQLQCLIDTTSVDAEGKNFFSKLVELTLEKMDNLKELCNGPFPSDFLKRLEKLKMDGCNSLQGMFFNIKLNLCNLKTLKLQNCPTLESLFQPAIAQSLMLLEELKIDGCKELKNIISGEKTKEEWGEEIVDGGNDSKSHGSMFPSLKVLFIHGCNKLQVILPFLSAGDIPVLETINIAGCTELKYIFGQYHHEHEGKDSHQEVKYLVLGSVKKMLLFRLPNFIDIFPACDHPMCSSAKKSSSKDGSNAHMQSKPTKCNIFPWNKLKTNIPLELDATYQPQECSISASNLSGLQLQEPIPCIFKQLQLLHNIKEIYLCKISKINSVFTLSTTRTMLLESLKIEKCHKLKDIITCIGDCRGINGGDVFPKLKHLDVEDCEQLEYIFGHYSHDDQNHKDIIHLRIPALESVSLGNLSNLIDMCSKSYQATLPTLKEFTLGQCPKYSINFVGDQLNSRHVKDQRRNKEYMLSLENLKVYKSNAQNIFCLDEMIEQQMTLPLQSVDLHDLPRMTYLFLGPKNSFFLQNLISIKIMRCEKLEIIFPTSTLRSTLPQLSTLIVVDCSELKQIIGADAENGKISNKTCFPKLKALVVMRCHKLKCIFPISLCEALPALKILMIAGADSLEEVFGGEEVDENVEFPNLMFVAFLKLHTFRHGIQFQSVKDRFVQFCPNLSLTSVMLSCHRIDVVLDRLYKALDWDGGLMDLFLYVRSAFTEHIRNQRREEKKPVQHSIAKTESSEDTNLSMHTNPDEHHQNESEIEFVENVVSFQPPSLAISPTDSELISRSSSSPLDVPLQQTHSHGIRISVEEGTSLAHGETIASSSTHSESLSSSSNPLFTSERMTYSQEDDESQTVIPSILAVNTLSGSATKNANVGGDSQDAIETNDPKKSATKDDDVQNSQEITEINESGSLNPCFSTINIDHSATKNVGAVDTQENTKTRESEYSATQDLDVEDTREITYTDEPEHFTIKDVDVEDSQENTNTNELEHSATKDIDVEDSQENTKTDESVSLNPCFSTLNTEDSTTKNVDVEDSGENTDQTHESGDFSTDEIDEPLSLNDDASTKVSSIVKEQLPNDDDMKVLVSNPSSILASPDFSSQSPSMPTEGKSSQLVLEDLSFGSLVTKELEQLVSKKYLSSENFTLLVDFLVKHPSVCLTSNSLSNRYKGYAYTCLVELLQFFRTHSLLDVLGSSHIEFVELLQDARRLGFDKDWLDGVERRALFPSLPVSHDALLQKLLDSKLVLAQHMDDLKHQLMKSITQQEAQVLETRAALSAPFGY